MRRKVDRGVSAIIVALIGMIVMTGCTNLWRMGVDGTGDRVQCSDGTWSNSGGNSGACSGHGGVGGGGDSVDGETEPVEPVDDIEVPPGYFDMGSGLAFRWADNANCNPTENPYLVCWGVEVLALRDCLPLPVDALIKDGSDNLVDTIQSSLPMSMNAGERQVADLLLAVPRSDATSEYFAEIQMLECWE
ncbi:hypothetical protein AB2L57_17970 (plasmid) [Microbacterium sp. HA-8]|uniref:hypothetical protein n=1 Tax=Microbacterium sp. HA-8 TaxID=3234200 RepID=UPI0038F63FF9